MGEPILIYGKSGSGKSRSLKGFGEDEIYLINVIGKRMPFPGKFKYVSRTRDYRTIMQGLLKMPTKVAVIDDAGYLQTSQFMEGHSAPKKGSNTFDLYNQIGDDLWRLLMFVKDQLPDDVLVYFMMHEISNDVGETKVRTIGKLIDEKVCLEGMFTICLHCMTDGKRHYFRTQGGPLDIAKSPEDMFDLEIENDLKAVDTRCREYWGMANG